MSVKMVKRIKHELFNREKWELLLYFLKERDFKELLRGTRSWTMRNLGRPIDLRGNGFSLHKKAPNQIPNPLERPRVYTPPLRKPEELDREQLVKEMLLNVRRLNAKVSVIIPCYNYGRFVKEAVDSILAQSYPNFEVIVVNDGSTDEHTKEVLPTLKSDKIRVFNQKNQGLSMARNNALSIAKGNFLLFLDADDTLDQDALLTMLYQFVLDPQAAMVYPQQHFFGDQQLVWCSQEFNAYDLLWAAHVTVCLMIRTEYFKSSKKYQPSMKYGYEDWEFSVGVAGKDWRPRLVPLPLFNHRRHGRTMTAEAHEKKQYLYNELIRLNAKTYTVERITELKRKWRQLISIIIPYYNSPAYVDETLACIKRQTTDDYEVILVDDGSDDPEARRKLDEIEASGMARVLRLEHRGTAAARNRGALEAKGEFLLFLDADDLIDSTYCEKLGLKLAMNPHLAFVYSGVVHFGAIQGVAFAEWDVEQLKRENFLAVTCLIRREIYLALGGMDEAMIHCHEDYDFWLRLADAGYQGGLVYEPLFHYRRHDRGKMAAVSRRMSDEEILALMRSRYPRLYGDPQGVQPEMKLIPPPPAGDTIIPAMASYYNQVAFGGKMSYEGYQRTNSPNLFQTAYHDPDRINILYLIPHMVIGGAERVDLEILSGLDRKRFRVILLVELTGQHDWYDKFAALCDEIFLCPNFISNNYHLDWLLDYLVIAKNIDIVFNRNTYAGYKAFERWKAAIPSMRLVDLIHLHNFGEDWVDYTAKMADLMHRRYFITEDLKTYALERYQIPADPIRVIHCGVDTDRFDPEKIAKGMLRQEMHKMPEQKIVGFVGRFDEQKNPLKWLEVARAIHQLDPNVYFAMIGGGPLLEPCMQWVRESGLGDYVHFCGFRNDVPNLLVDFDCLLLVSGYEGLPLVVFEAMSLGIPVVSSDAGGTRECVTEAVGAMLPIEAPGEDYARAVLDLLNRAQGDSGLARLCRQRIVENFTIAKMQRRYVAEFEEMFAEVNRNKKLKEYQIYLMHKAIFF